jgi:hypothetical protein
MTWGDLANARVPERDDSEFVRAVERELVAIIEDGEALEPDVFRPVTHGLLTLWSEKAGAFVGAVFGEAERQRVLEAGPASGEFSETLNARLARLRELRDRQQTWELQVTERGLRRAAADRRWLSPDDRIAVGGDARWPLPWPDKRRELAYDFDVLADDLDAYLAARAAARPEIEARNVAAKMETDDSLCIDEVRRDAADYSEKVAVANYFLGMSTRAGELFDRAVEEGVVSARARDEIVKPQSHRALDHLPRHLREIAERLRDVRDED